MGDTPLGGFSTTLPCLRVVNVPPNAASWPSDNLQSASQRVSQLPPGGGVDVRNFCGRIHVLNDSVERPERANGPLEFSNGGSKPATTAANRPRISKVSP